MLRVTKIFLIASIGIWALLGAVGNVVDWGGTIGAVQAATSMSTFDPVPASSRATTNAAIVLSGALFIICLKVASGVLCLWGAWQMWLQRAASASVFAKAKTCALTGCGVAMFLLFTGWIVIAETWYELWRSPTMLEPVLQSAFRYCGTIGVIALFVGAPEE